MSNQKEGGKLKGGAQKQREKRQKLLSDEASKCQKISDLFRARGSGGSGTSTANNCKEMDIEAGEGNFSSLPLPVHAEILNEMPRTVIDSDNASQSQECSVAEQLTHPTEVDIDAAEHLFQRPTGANFQEFFKRHPFQPTNVDDINLSFTSHRVFSRKDGINRQWLTYSSIKHCLYCTVCLAYGKERAADVNSCFIEGMSTVDNRHIIQRVEEHEKSKLHLSCVEAHMMSENGSDIFNLLFSAQNNLRAKQVQEKRDVIERVIEIIKVIGKRGLSYRGASEAAYSLNDETTDHGNFLEILKLLGKFDPVISNHLKTSISESQKRHDSAGSRTGQGRGGLVTLISKTTVNYIIEAIRKLMKEAISEDVNSAGMFSVQLDTTQDITVKDQCSIVIRYVTDKVYERLISVVNCTSSTGIGVFNMLKTNMENNGIDLKKCVGNSTDGAANMQGQYNGFTRWLSEEAPDQIHVWCYAHVLNLVLSDTTQTSPESIALFNLLNACAVFLRESYKRMDVRESVSDNNRHRRLNTIGDTRWWAKDSALKKIFGHFGDPTSSSYIDLLVTLEHLEKSTGFNSTCRDTARNLLEKLTKFETVITAQMYLRIFKHTEHLSKYLQTSGMDVLQAYRMVSVTTDELKPLARDFDTVVRAADTFVKWANEALELRDCSPTMIVENTFREVRTRKPTVMHGEKDSHTNVAQTARKNYEIFEHNCVVDRVVQTIKDRFSTHDTLFADISCLDPRNFTDIVNNGLPITSFTKISKLLTRFSKETTAEAIKEELQDFARKWNKLKVTAPEEYDLFEYEDIESTGEQRTSEDIECDADILVASSSDRTVVVGVHNVDERFCASTLTKKTKKACKMCPNCCYSVLLKYNLYSESYKHLFQAYKLILTLSSTQVACERSFSKLKTIKSRCRSALTADHLEAFMLMSIERDILLNLSNTSIINRVADVAPVLKKLLVV